MNFKVFFTSLKTSKFRRFEIEMNVFLIGYMGVGKTTIGKRLASRLELEFIDLDDYIGFKEGVEVSDVILQKGEPYFRELEKKYLEEVVKKNRVLVSTGGGAPCFFGNMQLINENGVSIYLKMDEKSLVNRLKNAKQIRPLISGKSETELFEFITQHLSERKPFYEQAHLTFEAIHSNSKTINQLAEEIKALG